MAEPLPSILGVEWGRSFSLQSYFKFTGMACRHILYPLSCLVHTGGVLELWRALPVVPDDTGWQAVGGPAGVRVQPRPQR